jgi:hypothetical protein
MSLAEDVKLSACGRHPSLFFLSFFLFYFSNSNYPFDVCACEKRLLLVFDRCFGVHVRGTPWALHISVPHPIVLYFLPR